MLNLPTVLVGLVVFGLLAAAVAYLVRKHKKGGGCGCNCAGCSGCCASNARKNMR